ncbi:MAG: hypothetical protein ACLSHU_11080 [Oscillospiraceae bacterium]
MEVMTFVVPCLFGLEGLAAEELRRLGLDSVQAENGRVLFQGGQEAMAMANLWLRTGERVLLRLAKGRPAPLRSCFKSWPPHLWKRSSPVMENSL